MSGIDHPSNAGLPSASDMDTAASRLDATTAALDRAVLGSDVLVSIVKAALTIAGPLGGALGMTGAEVLKRGVDLVAAKGRA